MTDTNNVIGSDDIRAGAFAQGRVLTASGVVRERINTGGRVVFAGVEQERINTICRVVEAGGVAIERLKTVGRIAETGGVFIERSKASGRVEAGGVAIQRTVTSGRVVVAANVIRERISASGTIEKPVCVAKKRKNASGGVEATSGVAEQGSKTRRRILVAGSEVVKRLETSAGVPDPSSAADEHPDTFAIVGAGYGALRVGTHRLHRRCKSKTGKHERDEMETPS